MSEQLELIPESCAVCEHCGGTSHNWWLHNLNHSARMESDGVVRCTTQSLILSHMHAAIRDNDADALAGYAQDAREHRMQPLEMA